MGQGACGLWAATLDRVLEAGGHHVLVAGRNFDPARTKGCEHVGVRAGNWVLDGRGASRADTFLEAWTTDPACLHEIREPDGGGMIGHMRNARALSLLDPVALEADMRAMGIGPGMVTRDIPGPAGPGHP